MMLFRVNWEIFFSRHFLPGLKITKGVFAGLGSRQLCLQHIEINVSIPKHDSDFCKLVFLNSFLYQGESRYFLNC